MHKDQIPEFIEEIIATGCPITACVSACKIDPISGVIGVQFWL